jgi:hypothetical protein
MLKVDKFSTKLEWTSKILESSYAAKALWQAAPKEKGVVRQLGGPYGCGLLWITQGLSIALARTKEDFQPMSNVIPLAPRLKPGRSANAEAEERAALAADLIELIGRVRELTEHVADLPGPPLQIQQTAQQLLDAGTALERAVDSLTEGGEWVPF